MASQIFFSQENYGYHFYGRAQNTLPHLRSAYDEVLKIYDVIVMPTLPYLPPQLPDRDTTITGQ